MHTCKVPGDALEDWLTQYPSTIDSYGHLLLEQIGDSDGALVDAFRPYFESAHLDARRHFHEEINIDLHPDAGAPGSHAVYPGCLPPTTRRGLFGEVMAGMLTEHYRRRRCHLHPGRRPGRPSHRSPDWKVHSAHATWMPERSSRGKPCK